MCYTFHRRPHLKKFHKIWQNLQIIQMQKLRKWKQNLLVQFKNDFILKKKSKLRIRLRWKVLHVCNSTFGTGLASTLNLLQRVTDKIRRTISQVSRSLRGRLGGSMRPCPYPLWAQRGAPHLAGGSSDCEPHFPELGLLNMVQIIGYVNMHNAF